MLRTLHRFRIIFLVFLAVSSIALAFSGLAYQFVSPNRSPGAIRIDDSDVSFRDVENERAELEHMYRSQFGLNFHRMLEPLGINLQQQAVDRAVQSALMNREAEALGFSATKKLVADQLAEEFAALPNPREQYTQFLQSIGMTPQEFEGRMQHALLRGQLEQAVRDSSIVSEKEAQAVTALEGTKYSVSYVALKADDFMSEVPAPSDEAIKNYYDDNASDFEVPARVSYSFVSLDPEKFLDIVEVFPDDVEIYYTDHQSDYMNPEKRAVRVIELRADTKAQAPKSKQSKGTAVASADAAFDKLVEEVEAKLKAGEAFASLAKSYSKHPSAKAEDAAAAGSLGTFTQADLAKEWGEAAAQRVFSLEAGKASDAIRDQNMARFFMVDSVIPGTPKELSEVRSEIEQIIRKREAPAFVAAKASELFEQWEKSSASLADFVAGDALKDRSLIINSSVPLAEKGMDPAAFTGLTERVLDQSDQRKQLLDLGDKSVLVEVTESREPEVPALNLVRQRIVELLKRREAGTRARKIAQTLVDELSGNKYPSLEAAASASGQKVKTEKNMTRQAPAAPFNEGDLKQALFSTSEANQAPTRVISVSGTHYVFQVSEITPPNEAEIAKELIKAREDQRKAASALVLAALINDRKAAARIDIQPGVLGRE